MTIHFDEILHKDEFMTVSFDRYGYNGCDASLIIEIDGKVVKIDGAEATFIAETLFAGGPSIFEDAFAEAIKG